MRLCALGLLASGIALLCGCGDAPQQPSPFAEVVAGKSDPTTPAKKSEARARQKFDKPEDAVRGLIEAGKASDLDGMKQCLTESSGLMIERNDLQATELAPPIEKYDVKPGKVREGFPFASVAVSSNAGNKTYFCRKETGDWLVDLEQELAIVEGQHENHKIYDVTDKMKVLILREDERPKGWLPAYARAAKTAPPGTPPSADFRNGEKPLPSQKDEAEQRFKNAADGIVRIQYYNCASVGDAQFRFWQLQQKLQNVPGYSELALAHDGLYLSVSKGTTHRATCVIRANALVFQMFNVTREEALHCAGNILKHTLSDNPH
jgi:hypothetical protein